MMWSLNAVADEEHSNSRRRNNRALSSSTSSSSSFSPYQNPRSTRTMEEVWKDINLSSSPMEALHNSTALRGIMFQDFLSGPYEKDPRALSASAAPPPPPPPPPQLPASMLTLNPGVDFNLFGSLSPPSRQSPAMLFPQLSVDGVGMNGHKRCAAATPDIEGSGGSGDRRHKRMIKNRESAARSRAYTAELELEVDQLTKENAKLREQQGQLRQVAAADRDHRSKRTLHRTSTAPF